jgi:predicted alpha-1,6-mannanase (GH76 family)
MMKDGGVSQFPIPVEPFLNDMIALAWIRAYDVTKNKDYLNTATGIFNDMVHTGANATCGGVWWRKKEPKGATAIANGLFISLAAHLANRQPNKSYYVNWAKKELAWFETAGFLKQDSRVQDSLDVKNGCKPIGGYWTYNHGVILGALVELNKAAPDPSLLAKAQAIANTATTYFADKQGVFHELFDNNTKKYPFPVGKDGISFKGAFMRNIAVLNQALGSTTYKDFINRQAHKVWENRLSNGSIGVNFAGPWNEVSMAAQQGVGVDTLAAAIAANPGSIAIPNIPAVGSKPSSAVKSSSHAASTAKSMAKSTSKIVTSTTSSALASVPTLASLKDYGFTILPLGDSITAGSVLIHVQQNEMNANYLQVR